MNKLFVFDLDDTLIHNKHNYAEPTLDAIKHIIRSVGPRAIYVTEILNLYYKIDTGRKQQIDPTTGRPFLYNRRRFPGSLVETYKEVCRRAGVIPKESICAELLAIGERAFSISLYKNNLHPSAKTVLSFIKKSGDSMTLLSKGDTEVQQDKFTALRNAGFGDFFDEWLIVDEKDSALFTRIKNRYLTTKVFCSVGNMYKSDIVPALEAGYRGIYAPDEHWESRDDAPKVDFTRCLVLNDLSEIVVRYPELEK